MRVKVQHLTIPQLDWVVAKCENHQWRCPQFLEEMGLRDWLNYEEAWGNPHPSYSTDWAHAGVIIDREHIDLRYTFTEGGYRTSASIDAVNARIWLPNGNTVFSPENVVQEYGNTALVAAMRCYVTAKLGEEVEIPDAYVLE